MNFYEGILNLIFPIQCGICGKLGSYICDECYDKLQRLEIKKQHENIFFVYKYEGIVRDLIIKYKFNDKSYLYKTFSKSLLKNKNLCNFLKCYDIITSVPLHKKRLNERGYNQSDLIIKELVKNLNNNLIENLDNNLVDNNKFSELRNYNSWGQNKSLSKNVVYYRNVLIKNKNIKPQSTKNVKDRIEDVSGIYEVKDAGLIKNKKILIFDDIYTTGSTLNECKKMILQAGATEVGIVALAKDYLN